MAGTLNQALGVGEALQRLAGEDGLSLPRLRRSHVGDSWLSGLPVLGALLAPTVVVSCGTSGERKGRRLKLARPNLVWAHVEVPKAVGMAPDINAIPAHDWTDDLSGSNTLVIQGVPHRIRSVDLEPLRRPSRHALGRGEGEPVALFLIGGPNEAFDFGAGFLPALRQRTRDAAEAGFLVILLPSRRTPTAVRQGLRELAGPHVICADGKQVLAYRDYLAAADRIFVTEDSISMTCETAASRRPVSWLPLQPRDNPRLAKFRRFQERWRPLLFDPTDFAVANPAVMADIPDDTTLIASEIRTVLRRRGVWPPVHPLQEQ